MYQHEQHQHGAISDEDSVSAWRRAIACNPSGNCVEINRSTVDHVGVRDSKQPAAGALRFDAESWAAFLINVTHRNAR